MTHIYVLLSLLTINLFEVTNLVIGFFGDSTRLTTYMLSRLYRKVKTFRSDDFLDYWLTMPAAPHRIPYQASEKQEPGIKKPDKKFKAMWQVQKNNDQMIVFFVMWLAQSPL